MKSDKRQSLAMIGIVLLVLAGIMIYISLSAPRVYEEQISSASTVSVSDETEPETVVSETESSELSVSYPLNLNTASAEELMTIDGLGEKRAYSIVEYRKEIGKYTDVSQVMNIKGIGEYVYNKILPYLTV